MRVEDGFVAFAVAADGCSGRELAGAAQLWLSRLRPGSGDRPATCTVLFTFAPTSRGFRRARLELAANAVNGSPSLPLIGAGIVLLGDLVSALARELVRRAA